MEKEHDIRRRDLLKVSGAAAVAGTMAWTASAGAREATEQIPPAMGHIETNSLKCSGCRTCAIVCSLNHGDQCGPTKARIRIIQESRDLFNTTMITCKQCETPMCYNACHANGGGAMYIDETTGARVIDQEACIGCQVCAKACPQWPNSPIYYDEDSQTCFKCDLCGGDPQCLKFCPMSASFSDRAYPVEEHPLAFVRA